MGETGVVEPVEGSANVDDHTLRDPAEDMVRSKRDHNFYRARVIQRLDMLVDEQIKTNELLLKTATATAALAKELQKKSNA